LKKHLSDNKWADKQILGFTEWLNYTFKKYDFAELPEEAGVSLSGTLEVADIAAMNHIMQRRREAKIRQCAVEKFADLKGPLGSVDREVSEGRIALREDRDLLADVGLQEIFFQLLFSYELVWLRLGIEVVFGEILSLPQVSRKVSGDESTQVIMMLFCSGKIT